MKKYFLLVLIILISKHSFATDVVSYQPHPFDVVNRAYDVVSGVVVSDIHFTGKPNKCFSNLIKLKVDDSFKGSYHSGEIIEVGITTSYPKLEAGSRYLVVVNKKHDKFFSWCKSESFPQAYSKESVLITSDIFLLKDNDLFFSYSCAENYAVLYEKELSGKIKIETIDSDTECRKVKGSYSALKEHIARDIDLINSDEKLNPTDAPSK